MIKINKTLTPGESLYIARRRTGKTQEEFAKMHKVTVDQLYKWETDIVPKDRDGVELPIPKREITWAMLEPREVCVVLRRRSGKTRVQVAQELGCSPQWLSGMETGIEKPDKLCEHWGVEIASTP